jgi:hypothetical protein
MLLLLEKWLKRQNRKIFKAHIRRDGTTFYKKRGFVELLRDDPWFQHYFQGYFRLLGKAL